MKEMDLLTELSVVVIHIPGPGIPVNAHAARKGPSADNVQDRCMSRVSGRTIL